MESVTAHRDDNHQNIIVQRFQKTPEEVTSKIIDSIVFYGNNRTSDFVIKKNIQLEVGKEFNKDLFQNTLTNLKDLEIFSKVNMYIFENRQNRLEIEIDIHEKWTTIPYFIAGSGGGSSYLAFGLYDTNFLGQLYTFNFTYICKNYNCSTIAFFRNPHTFDK